MTFRSLAGPALAACGALVLALGAALAVDASRANDRLTIALDWVPNTFNQYFTNSLLPGAS